MKFLLRTLILAGLKVATWKRRRAFDRALSNPQQAQAKVLRRIARLALRSRYGQAHGLTSDSEFRARLPIVTYEELAPWIERARSGGKGILSPERILFFERTSGSSGRAKEIPYTAALLRTFQNLFLLWTHDLLQSIPTLGQGRFYFLVTPRFSPAEFTPDGTPVGLESDADYLGGFLKLLLAPFLVEVPGASRIQDPSVFKNAVARAWLSHPDLESLSIWNPSFLRTLMDWIRKHRHELATELENSLSDGQKHALLNDPIPWTKLFPKLKVISCWADAHARAPAEKIASEFPGVLLQGKGLLATEAPITLPLHGVQGCVPLLDQVYLEFETPEGHLLELHALEQGGIYSVIVSQPGGLYRYRLGDQVKVVSRHQATPTLEFVGRGNQISDLVGEKLSETWVKACLDQALGKESTFRHLLPCRTPSDHYLLILDACSETASATAARMEEELKKAHHYGLARKLDQLGPLQVVVHPQAAESVTAFYQRQGQRLGDIKNGFLSPRIADLRLLNELNSPHEPIGVAP